KNLATASHGKKTTHLLIPSIRYVGKDGREIFDMPIPDALITDEIKGAPYYGEYQEHVAKYQQHLDVEHGKAAEKGATESSKDTKETLDEPSPAKRSKGGRVRKIRKPMSSLKEPDSGRIQSLPEVQGKGKEKVVKEQAAHDLLTLQTPKNKSPVDQFIFQRRTSMPAEASGPAESPSLDAKLALIECETESDDEVPKINTGDQDEGQAGPNPGEQDKGHAGSNPGDAAGSQPQQSHVVPAGPKLEPMDLKATDASTLQIPKKMDEEFTTTAYPSIQENLKLLSEEQVIPGDPASSTGTLSSLQNLEKDLCFTYQFFIKKQQEKDPVKTNAEAEVQSMFFIKKQQEKDPVKTNAEAEVQSMVSVPIHQDTSSVSLMTTLTIDLTLLQSNAPLPTSTTTTSAMEECHKLLTDQVDWTNPEGDQVRIDVNRPLPLGGPPGHVTIQFQFFFNKELEYLRYGSKGSSPALSISKMKVASYLDFGLELLVPEQMWIEDLSSLRLKLFPMDSSILDDSIPDEQIWLFDDEDSGNDHLPKADSRKDRWKPLPERKDQRILNVLGPFLLPMY
nr:hypothetical protein [Tanacetum cinerariifolium]